MFSSFKKKIAFKIWIMSLILMSSFGLSKSQIFATNLNNINNQNMNKLLNENNNRLNVFSFFNKNIFSLTNLYAAEKSKKFLVHLTNTYIDKLLTYKEGINKIFEILDLENGDSEKSYNNFVNWFNKKSESVKKGLCKIIEFKIDYELSKLNCVYDNNYDLVNYVDSSFYNQIDSYIYILNNYKSHVSEIFELNDYYNVFVEIYKDVTNSHENNILDASVKYKFIKKDEPYMANLLDMMNNAMKQNIQKDISFSFVRDISPISFNFNNIDNYSEEIIGNLKYISQYLLKCLMEKCNVDLSKLKLLEDLYYRAILNKYSNQIKKILKTIYRGKQNFLNLFNSNFNILELNELIGTKIRYEVLLISFLITNYKDQFLDMFKNSKISLNEFKKWKVDIFNLFECLNSKESDVKLSSENYYYILTDFLYNDKKLHEKLDNSSDYSDDLFFDNVFDNLLGKKRENSDLTNSSKIPISDLLFLDVESAINLFDIKKMLNSSDDDVKNIAYDDSLNKNFSNLSLNQSLFENLSFENLDKKSVQPSNNILENEDETSITKNKNSITKICDRDDNLHLDNKLIKQQNNSDINMDIELTENDNVNQNVNYPNEFKVLKENITNHIDSLSKILDRNNSLIENKEIHYRNMLDFYNCFIYYKDKYRGLEIFDTLCDNYNKNICFGSYEQVLNSDLCRKTVIELVKYLFLDYYLNFTDILCKYYENDKNNTTLLEKLKSTYSSISNLLKGLSDKEFQDTFYKNLLGAIKTLSVDQTSNKRKNYIYMIEFIKIIEDFIFYTIDDVCKFSVRDFFSEMNKTINDEIVNCLNITESYLKNFNLSDNLSDEILKIIESKELNKLSTFSPKLQKSIKDFFEIKSNLSQKNIISELDISKLVNLDNECFMGLFSKKAALLTIVNKLHSYSSLILHFNYISDFIKFFEHKENLASYVSELDFGNNLVYCSNIINKSK